MVQSRRRACARLCNRHIVDNSLEKLEELAKVDSTSDRSRFPVSIDHARRGPVALPKSAAISADVYP